jgi:putative FmdB family regulatory protein
MPIYEYECQSCKVRFERKQSVHDDPVRTCPECGGTVRKLFFPAGIIFKGSGFYKTDNASASSSAAAKADAPPSVASSSKTEPVKTDAAKTEPVKTDAAKTEPSTGKSSKSDAGKSDAGKSDS